MAKLEEQIDFIAAKLINMDEKIDVLQGDAKRQGSQQERIFNKLDEFITVLKRNEEELTMTQARYDRLEARIAALEAARS